MRKTGIGFILFIFLFSIIAVAIAHSAKNNGPANLEITGGKKGDVPFPHRMHQNNLKDCNICHTLFPKKHNAIDDLKAQKKLKKKKVMNALCLSCHKREKKAGRDHGPTKCSACHIK